MDERILKSVFSIRDAEDELKGIAFILSQDERFTYLLTCKHVVLGSNDKPEEIYIRPNTSQITKGKNRESKFRAKVFKFDRTGTFDLAVLRVERLFSLPIPLLDLDEQEQDVRPDDDALLLRWFRIKEEHQTPFLRPFQAKFSADEANAYLPGGDYKLWNIKPLSTNLEDAMSGSPVVHKKSGRVIGVLAYQDYPSIEKSQPHIAPEGGFAVPVRALRQIWANHRFFPFTNRKEELKIHLEQAKKYYWIDGPIGYGKTRLLLKLKDQFLDKNWLCAFVQVRSGFNLNRLTLAIATEFEVAHLLQHNHNIDPGLDLGAALSSRWKAVSKTSPGIALLLDLDGPLKPELFRQIVREFIPQYMLALESRKEFNIREKSLRIVVAGRHINAYHFYREPETRRGPDEDFRLLPYSFEHINDSVQIFLKDDKDTNDLLQFAAHIYHLTGGYPRAVADIAHKFSAMGIPLNEILTAAYQAEWDQIIDGAVKEIVNGLPKQDSEVTIFAQTNVLRWVDTDALDEFITQNDGLFRRNLNGKKLKDILFIPRIIESVPNVPLYVDDMIRRVVSLQLRRENLSWQKRCQQAMTICANRLRGEKNRSPAAWFREYLFQSLQQHANEISEAVARDNVYSKFFDLYLVEAVKLMLTEGQRDGTTEWDTVSESLEQDWELRFTLNYFLRDDQYLQVSQGENKVPWDQFYEEVESLFLA